MGNITESEKENETQLKLMLPVYVSARYQAKYYANIITLREISANLHTARDVSGGAWATGTLPHPCL